MNCAKLRNFDSDKQKGRIPEVTIECIHYLRQRYPGVKVSVEAEKPNRPGLQELAAEADIVFYSKSWAKVNTSTSLLYLAQLLTNRCAGSRLPKCRGMSTNPSYSHQKSVSHIMRRRDTCLAEFIKDPTFVVHGVTKERQLSSFQR